MTNLRKIKSVPSTLTKIYPERGPLQQFRFAEATAFRCLRCDASKKAKLITIYGGDESKRLCNGCYGFLLKLYNVKAGTGPHDKRVEELVSLLHSRVSVYEQQQAERLLVASEARASRLSPEALRFLATSEYLAKQLLPELDLEWSPVIIGLCKAVEMEIVNCLIRPLAQQTISLDLKDDREDKDIGRVTIFCANPDSKPPELGAVTHFLQTVTHSKNRRSTNKLILTFLDLASNWTGSQWILDPQGLQKVAAKLSTEFRNKAAHIDEMSKEDYRRCRELVIGSEGILWKLDISVEGHK